MQIDVYMVLFPINEQRRFGFRIDGHKFIVALPDDLTAAQCIRVALDTLSYWVEEMPIRAPRINIHLDVMPHGGSIKNKFRLEIKGEQRELTKSTNRLKDLLLGDSYLSFFISPNGGKMI